MAVESTFNWYWLVDGLREDGFDIRLANTTKMQENIGLKEANDKTDARYIARQLTMGVLPEGYIYPKETRGVRDKMRQRLQLVQCRTSEVLSLEGLIARYTGVNVNPKRFEEEDFIEILANNQPVIDMALRKKRHIDFLNVEIKSLEAEILKELPDKEKYKILLTMAGVGEVLARTILLETGTIERFPGAGNYASYCRAVSAKHTSNGKKKAKGNSKNGNRYLGWAFVEAATFAVRFSPQINAWFQRKEAKSGKRVIAIKALANKLSKAAYYMLKNNEPFDVNRLIK